MQTGLATKGAHFRLLVNVLVLWVGSREVASDAFKVEGHCVGQQFSRTALGLAGYSRPRIRSLETSQGRVAETSLKTMGLV